MKTSKKYLAILLTLCTLLCSIVSYSIYAVTVEEETPVSADADMGNEEELMPMAASGCGNLSSWFNIDHDTKATILGDVSGNYKSIVGNNPNIYYDSNGTIYLCGVGAYAGTTYQTDLQRSWYI